MRVPRTTSAAQRLGRGAAVALALCAASGAQEPAGEMAASSGGVRVRIRMLEGLRFDPPRFRVEPGARLRLELINADSTDLAHNFLLSGEPGSRLALVQAAAALGENGPVRAYVPDFAGLLAASRLLQAGEREELELTAPAEAGVYPYVCTFPGHGLVMFGALYVGLDLPPLEEDPHLPDLLKGKLDGEVRQRPFVQRIFLPGAGPAALAAALRGGDQNACWDPGVCGLRYLWKGRFLDGGQHWSSKGQPLAEILGEVYWPAGEGSGIRFGKAGAPRPRLAFRGYALENGEPRFLYEADGVAVSERLAGDAETGGVLREFTVADPPGPVWLDLPAAPGVEIEASAGTLSGDGLLLSAEEAKAFTVRMRRVATQP